MLPPIIVVEPAGFKKSGSKCEVQRQQESPPSLPGIVAVKAISGVPPGLLSLDSRNPELDAAVAAKIADSGFKKSRIRCLFSAKIALAFSPSLYQESSPPVTTTDRLRWL